MRPEEGQQVAPCAVLLLSVRDSRFWYKFNFHHRDTWGKQHVFCVCSRSELDLRQKLLQRDERITQLKEQLAERTRAMEDLRRRALHSSHEGAGSGSGARTSGDELQGRAARSGLRSRSPSPVRVSATTHLVP